MHVFLGDGGEARFAFHKRMELGMFGCYRSGNVLHVCIDKWKDVGWRFLLFHGVICAAEEDTASVVGLVHALVLLVRIQEDIFPSLPRSLVGDSVSP